MHMVYLESQMERLGIQLASKKYKLQLLANKTCKESKNITKMKK